MREIKELINELSRINIVNLFLKKTKSGRKMFLIGSYKFKTFLKFSPIRSVYEIHTNNAAKNN